MSTLLNWEQDLNLVNPSWATADGTGWTNHVGTFRYSAGAGAKGILGYVNGSSNVDHNEMYQDIAVPPDAKMLWLQCWVNSTYTDRDLPMTWVEFLDDGGGTILAYCGHAALLSGDTVSGWVESGSENSCFIPDGAATVRLWTAAWRQSGGTSNNAAADECEIWWHKQSGDFTVSGDLVVNGGFETGDTTGWVVAGGVITDSASYICPENSVWCYGAGTSSTWTAEQIIDVSGLMSDGYVYAQIEAWLSSSGSNEDQTRMYVYLLDEFGVEIGTTRPPRPGPSSGGYPQGNYSQFTIEMPANLHSIRLYFLGDRNSGTANNCAIDNVSLRLFSLEEPILPPIIDVQPEDILAGSGEIVSFSVEAHKQNSESELSYQWYEQTAGLIIGETLDTYTFLPDYPGDSGNVYYVNVIDSLWGALASDTATLSIVFDMTRKFIYEEDISPIKRRGVAYLSRALRDNETLQFRRKTPISHGFDPQPLVPFKPNELEYVLDKICYIQQEIEGHLCDCRGPVWPPPGVPVDEEPPPGPEIPDLPQCLPYDCDAFGRAIKFIGLSTVNEFLDYYPGIPANVIEITPDKHYEIISDFGGRTITAAGTSVYGTHTPNYPTYIDYCDADTGWRIYSANISYAGHITPTEKVEMCKSTSLALIFRTGSGTGQIVQTKLQAQYDDGTKAGTIGLFLDISTTGKFRFYSNTYPNTFNVYLGEEDAAATTRVVTFDCSFNQGTNVMTVSGGIGPGADGSPGESFTEVIADYIYNPGDPWEEFSHWVEGSSEWLLLGGSGTRIVDRIAIGSEANLTGHIDDLALALRRNKSDYELPPECTGEDIP